MIDARKTGLARSAAKTALQLRVRGGFDLGEPCDVYSLIEKHGLDLQFMDVPSLEGMYLNEREAHRICVSAHRPTGRQRFTAAHEFGHHSAGHGSSVDKVLEYRANAVVPEHEFVADTFARFLLMPNRAVQRGFRERNHDPSAPTPDQVYRVAGWLGVGYTTLLEQMRFSLDILAFDAYRRLKATKLKSVKALLTGLPPDGDIWIVDQLWAGMRLHAKTGDLITGVMPASGCTVLKQASEDHLTFVADRVGEDECGIVGDQKKLRVSVSRPKYIGFYDYMYLED